MRRVLLGVALAALAATQVLAQGNDPRRAVAGAVGTVATPLVLGAAFPVTSHWATVHTQKWFYPWHLSHTNRFPFVSTNFPQQTVNAVQQHVSNIANPKYFNEAIHLDLPNKFPDTGTHKVKADYKKHHSSKSPAGKIVVGCGFFSALGAITASVVKASALGNPPRWRSQAEHERIVASGAELKYEMTADEWAISPALCGLGSIYVMAQYVRR